MENFSANLPPKTPVWKKVLGSIIFWWLLLTITYFIIFNRASTIFVEQQVRHIYQWPTDSITHIGQFLGLFVPIGPNNLVVMLPFGIIIFIIGLIVYYKVLIKKYHFDTLAKKIISSFLTLFLITLVLDLLFFQGRWCSLMVFTHTDYSVCSRLSGIKLFENGFYN